MNEVQVLGWSLEAAFDCAWPGLKTIPAGDWLCKSARSENGLGVSRRANSANPSGAHARLTEAGIARIEAVYAKLGQPTYVRLPSLIGEDADRLLEARGYAAEGNTVTLIGPAEARAHGEAELTVLPSPEWLAALNRINGARARGRGCSTRCWRRSTSRPPMPACAGRAGSWPAAMRRRSTAGCA